MSNIATDVMPRWQAADAKQNFGRLVEAAQGEPQLLVRHAEPVGVVLSIADYQRLREQADAEFAKFLIGSPLEPSDFDRGIGARLSDA